MAAAGSGGKHGQAREMNGECARLVRDRFERQPHRLGCRVTKRLDEGPRLVKFFRRNLRDDCDERVAHACLRKVTTSSSMNGPTKRGRPTLAIPRATSGATSSGSCTSLTPRPAHGCKPPPKLM